MQHATKPAPFDPAAKERRLLIAKIHLAKKEMGLGDDDYRAMLVRVTTRLSSADCTVPELRAMVEEMKRQGFKPRPSTRAGGKMGAADHPAAKKARALWISLHHLGAIHNPSEQALEAFAKRQLGCDRMQWANQAHAYKLIEALKAIGERNGWSFKSSLGRVMGLKAPPPSLQVLKVRLVERIAHLLAERKLVPIDWSLRDVAWRIGGMEREGPVPLWELGDLDLLAKALGDKLREAGR